MRSDGYLGWAANTGGEIKTTDLGQGGLRRWEVNFHSELAKRLAAKIAGDIGTMDLGKGGLLR